MGGATRGCVDEQSEVRGVYTMNREGLNGNWEEMWRVDEGVRYLVNQPGNWHRKDPTAAILFFIIFVQ